MEKKLQEISQNTKNYLRLLRKAICHRIDNLEEMDKFSEPS